MGTTLTRSRRPPSEAFVVQREARRAKRAMRQELHGIGDALGRIVRHPQRTIREHPVLAGVGAVGIVYGVYRLIERARRPAAAPAVAASREHGWFSMLKGAVKSMVVSSIVSGAAEGLARSENSQTCDET